LPPAHRPRDRVSVGLTLRMFMTGCVCGYRTRIGSNPRPCKQRVSRRVIVLKPSQQISSPVALRLNGFGRMANNRTRCWSVQQGIDASRLRQRQVGIADRDVFALRDGMGGSWLKCSQCG
jgi:hypothetical protein